MSNGVEKILRGWCTDWDGSEMDRGEPPRDGIHCDCLLDAADEIEAMDHDIARLLESLRLAEEEIDELRSRLAYWHD